MSRLTKDTLNSSRRAAQEEELGEEEASINNILPVEPVVVLLPGIPATTPEKKNKKHVSPSSSTTSCVKFSSQRLHQLASARRYQYHSLDDEKELQFTTINRQSAPLVVVSEPQSPSPASSTTTNEETLRSPDMAALKRLGERRERLGRLRRQQSAPPYPRFTSSTRTQNEHKLSSTVKDDVEDSPTPSRSLLLPSPNKKDDFKTAGSTTILTNEESPTSKKTTPGNNSNRFNMERCQELQAHRAKYHYGGVGVLSLESSPLQAKVKKIESIPLDPSPQALQRLVELGRRPTRNNSPFALPSPTSFGYHRANNNHKKSAECSSLLHLGHLLNGTTPAPEDDRGSSNKVSPAASHPRRGQNFEDSATTADSSVLSSSVVCSVPSHQRRGGRSRLVFWLACLFAVGYMGMQSGLWAGRELYHSHFCPGVASGSGWSRSSCIRPDRRLRDKQQDIAIPRAGSETIHSVEGYYAQDTPRSLGRRRSLWDRIDLYVKEFLPRPSNRIPAEVVPEKETTTSSRSKKSRPKSSRRRRGGNSQSKSILDQDLSLESWTATSQAKSCDFESVFDLSRSVNKVSLPCRNRVNVPQRLAYRKMQAWTAASFANEVALQCSNDQEETDDSSMWDELCPVQHDENTFTADVVISQPADDRDLQNTTSSEQQPGCTLVPPDMESGFSRDAGWIYFNTPWMADGVFQVNPDFFRQASAQHVIQPARNICTAEKRVDQQPLLANTFTRFGKFLRKQQDRVQQILHQLRTIEMDKVEALLQI
jgi:hypothetical protein